MRITIELRRPRRRSVALLMGLLLLSAPAAVVANHQFPDVPNSNPFHAQIGAIAEAGITAGFPDGGFNPSDPVTRQAMAAFMQRGFGRVGLAVGGVPLTSSVAVAADSTGTSPVPVRRVTITVPGANNDFSPTQLIHLFGSVTFYAPMTNSVQGCPCQFAALIRDTTSDAVSGAQGQTFESDFDLDSAYTFNVEALFAAPPGARTYELQVWLSFRLDDTFEIQFALDPTTSLSAMTFPFGPAGTNDL